MRIESELSKINITINKAKIVGLSFDMSNPTGLPHVSAQIDLFSVGGNKVTSVTLSTSSWQDANKLSANEIEIETYLSLEKILRQLSSVCIRKINAIDKFLPAPTIQAEEIF